VKYREHYWTIYVFSPTMLAALKDAVDLGRRKLIVVIFVAVALIEWEMSRVLINRSSAVSG